VVFARKLNDARTELGGRGRRSNCSWYSDAWTGEIKDVNPAPIKSSNDRRYMADLPTAYAEAWVGGFIDTIELWGEAKGASVARC
jgi:hypothetical protein